MFFVGSASCRKTKKNRHSLTIGDLALAEKKKVYYLLLDKPARWIMIMSNGLIKALSLFHGKVDKIKSVGERHYIKRDLLGEEDIKQL